MTSNYVVRTSTVDALTATIADMLALAMQAECDNAIASVTSTDAAPAAPRARRAPRTAPARKAPARKAAPRKAPKVAVTVAADAPAMTRKAINRTASDELRKHGTEASLDALAAVRAELNLLVAAGFPITEDAVRTAAYVVAGRKA